MECVSDSTALLVVEAVPTLDERPLGFRQVIVRLRIRRFFSDRKSCVRKAFVEQVPGLSERYRRSSTWLMAPDRASRVLGWASSSSVQAAPTATVLVDVEAGRVGDVLPDRTSETFAAWLTEHPGAEIICRGRASAYTKVIKEAARPDRHRRLWEPRRLLSAAAQLVATARRRHLRFARHRPWTDLITEAIQRLAALPNPG